MNLKIRVAGAVILAASLVLSCAYASDPAPESKKAKIPPQPSVTDKIADLEKRIEKLESDLDAKDAALKQAQRDAASAKAEAGEAKTAADKAIAAITDENQALTGNAAAVSTLQSTVDDMKNANALAVGSLSDDEAAIKKSIANPGVIHFKGIDVTPGGFVAGETVYRTKATGGDIATAFSGLPYEGADAYSLSEFFGSARQTRFTLMAQGKLPWGTIGGYYEGDFLGSGTTSNANQSNSYVLRQRILYAQAETTSKWTIAAGQLWSLVTEQSKGISNAVGNVLTPPTIDPNYIPGFAWTRQYGFRVVKSFPKVALAAALENPQLIYSASLAGSTPYAVLGSAGNSSGLFNSTISACSPSTSIVNYSNQQSYDSAGNLVQIAVPVYKTVNSCANVANLSFNKAPDVLVKAAFDPGWGHYEIFGLAGFAHETVYPGETTDRTLYGGLTDVLATQMTGSTVLAAPALTTVGSYSNSITLGGFGGNLLIPVITDKVNFGFRALYGPGVGRYGDSTLADVTADASGRLAPIHNASGLFTLDVTPTKRLTIWMDYGADYAGRTDFSVAPTATTPGTTTLGSPNPCFISKISGDIGCLNETAQGNFSLKLDPTVQSLSGSYVSAADIAKGSWGAAWYTYNSTLRQNVPNAPQAAVGYGSRFANNSGCSVIANPGYNGSSTGYYSSSPSNCVGHTRNVQEITGGWWYDIYRSDKGRFRQGFQYGYAVREGWSGAPVIVGGPGYGAKGIDNMVWTSLRYYLP